jgi:acyl-coenzyme A synthetase/AMP-(fatty) acid ligase
VVQLLLGTEHWYGFDEHDVWVLFHSFAFDFSVWEIWGALAYGGRLVIPSYWLTRTPSDFLDLLCAEGVTVLNQTPSAFWQIAREDEARARDLPLRTVIFGGESLDFRLLRGWYGRHHQDRPRLINMYGITETTVFVTYRPVKASDSVHPPGNAIGVEIPVLSVYLLDSNLRPVPIGVAGELYVGGTGVARCYWNRPGLTAEKFPADCYGGVEGARMYRSGDRARWVERNGTLELEFLGRFDHQVKMRGFRVEPGEIEALLRQQSGVRDAVVLADEEEGKGKRLAAFVTQEPGCAVTCARLRDVLKAELPAYMVPTRWALVSSLPLNTNGKLDRSALLRPQVLQDDGQAESGPADAIERIVWRIWRDVLETDAVTRDESFFDAGGHSILALQMIARTNSTFHMSLSIRTLFENATPAGLAGAVRQQLRRSRPDVAAQVQGALVP